ncbi:MAG: head maturation protease, ClpP-related [Candidatus Methylumidiphilus sp.]
MEKFFAVRNEADQEEAEILVYDRIGKESGSGISASDVSNALRDIPPAKQILVRINSPGGNLWDGIAIHNLLNERRQFVTCQVDGIAASSASLIAISGKTTRMPESGLLMIHLPRIGAFGTSEELRAEAQKLDRHTDTLTTSYAKKSGRSTAEVLAKMAVETWFSAVDALSFGLIDLITGSPATAMASDFDLSAFRNAPRNLASRGEILLDRWGFENPNYETLAQRWTRFYGNT